jgi:hypothetical protein
LICIYPALVIGYVCSCTEVESNEFVCLYAICLSLSYM